MVVKRNVKEILEQIETVTTDLYIDIEVSNINEQDKRNFKKHIDRLHGLCYYLMYDDEKGEVVV